MDKQVSKSLSVGDTIATDAFGREGSLKKVESLAQEIRPLDSHAARLRLREQVCLPQNTCDLL